MAETVSITNLLSHKLSEIIEKRQNDFLRVVNSGLVVLFWTVGKKLNQFLVDNKSQTDHKYLFKVISALLVKIYGPYFLEKNLKYMGQFVIEFPDLKNVIKIAAIVSWEHIYLLLNRNDSDFKIFYIELIAKEGLSVKALSERILAMSFEQNKALEINKDRKIDKTRLSRHVKTDSKRFSNILRTGLKQQACNRSAIKNPFRKPFLPYYRPLMESSKEVIDTLNRQKNQVSEWSEELFGVLAQEIEKFKITQTRWINSHVNISHWQIGKLINQEVPIYHESVSRNSVIRDVSIDLEKHYGESFSKKRLHEMSMFSNQVTDLTIATRIAYLVRWDHIVALLSLKSIEAILFYARKTATQGLSVAALRREIGQEVYEHTAGAKQTERHTIATIQTPIVIIDTKKTKNQQFTVTSNFISLGDDLDQSKAVNNIFKDQHLIDFVSKF